VHIHGRINVPENMYKPSHQCRPISVTVLITALIGALLLVIPQSNPAHADSSGGGGDFVPLTNAGRLVDTRNGTGISGTAPLRDGQDKAFKVLGVGGVPAAGVRAVLVDVAIVAPTNHTWFRLWADGTPMPGGTSMVHSIPDNNFSNSVVVPVGANGSVRVYNNTGTAHAVIDVQGYFTATTTNGGTGGFIPITQTRALDTRETGGEIKANASRTVNLAVGGVPSTATSAFVNLSVGAAAEGSVELSASASATGGSFNHPTGTSSTGMSVKLSAGKATITNSSLKPIDVVIDVQGYFSPTSTLGAGYREANARLLDTRTTLGGGAIAARSTREIAVGGAGGMPVRSLAGVLLNFQTLQGTDGGWISAWPTGTSRPTPTVGNTPAGDTRAELAVIKPGTNGKVSVYNGSDTPINLILDLEGYFLDPLPPVAIEANSRTSIVQATASDAGGLGHLEFSYVDNSGQLRHGDIPNPDVVNNQDTITVQTLSGGEAFTGTPAIAEQANGKLLIAGHHTESNVWAKTETLRDPVPDWPSAWTKLGGSIRSHAVVGKLSDGRLVLFGVDVDGALWASAQTAANSAFGAWISLGDVNLTGTPVVVSNPGGVIQVFARNTSGNIVTAMYSTAGALSSWAGLGNPGVALDDSGVPAVAVGPTLIRVFVRTPAGEIATQQQSVGGAWSGNWETIPGAAAGGPPTAVAHPTNGTYQVLSRTSGGDFQWVSELTRNSGNWSTWNTFSSPVGALISDPTAFAWTAKTPSWGVIYRTGNDINQIANLTDTTPPPAPEGGQRKARTAKKSSTAKKSATGSRSTPEFHTYTAPK
jgi:hypothetical protein